MFDIHHHNVKEIDSITSAGDEWVGLYEVGPKKVKVLVENDLTELVTHIVNDDIKLVDVILNWYYECSKEAWLSHWGFEGLENVYVDRDYDNECKCIEIVKKYGTINTYQVMTGDPFGDDFSEKPLIFDNAEKAYEWIEKTELNRVHILGHNEYGYDYKVIPADMKL